MDSGNADRRIRIGDTRQWLVAGRSFRTELHVHRILVSAKPVLRVQRAERDIDDMKTTPHSI